MRLKPSETNHEGNGCDDCGKKSPAMFLLHTALWDSIAEPDTYLCLKCTEKRLGRKITWEDLSPCGVSDMLLLGALLMKRDLIDIDESILDKI